MLQTASLKVASTKVCDPSKSQLPWSKSMWSRTDLRGEIIVGGVGTESILGWSMAGCVRYR